MGRQGKQPGRGRGVQGPARMFSHGGPLHALRGPAGRGELPRRVHTLKTRLAEISSTPVGPARGPLGRNDGISSPVPRAPALLVPHVHTVPSDRSAADEPPPAEADEELRGLLRLMLIDRLKQQENEALAANDLRLYQEIHERRKALAGGQS